MANTYKYMDYLDKLRGYEIFNKKTNAVLTKIEYYFIASNENIASLIAGVNENYGTRNKPGWEDGKYTRKKDYTAYKIY